MSLTTRTPGKQLYTLLVTHKESPDTRNICTYGAEGAILTTDYEALLEYASMLAIHFGKSRTYTTALIDPVVGDIDYILGENNTRDKGQE